MASSSSLYNFPRRLESNAGIIRGFKRELTIAKADISAGIIRGFKRELTIAKVDISQVNKWLKNELTPASNWGVSVGVSGFGLMLIVTLLVAYIRDRD